MAVKNKKRGKLIVIEGTDGSGKGTQVTKLIERLKKEKYPVEITDFPQYGKASAYFVEKYLRGEYGTSKEIGPYIASTFYALDRFDKSFEMKKILDSGTHIVSNRYVSSSMGHQTGKIEGKVHRDKYLKWVDNFEHKMLNSPRADLIIFLNVPPAIGQKLVDQKVPREYTDGKKRDIHEADLDHLKKASEAYKYISQKFNWKVIECTKKGKLMGVDEIHKLVWEKVRKVV
jgi:dTMP kinase